MNIKWAQLSKIGLGLVLWMSLALPGFTEPPNLILVRNETRHYFDNGQYLQEVSQQIAKAQAYIQQQVQHNAHSKHPKKLAIVLDIDETSLSNYPQLAKNDFQVTDEQFHQYIAQATAPALQPTLALYKDAIRQNISVFFITGRHEDERGATEKNLKRAGFTKWNEIYLRPTVYTYRSIIPFKAGTRAKIRKAGYTIVASIGDQYSDFLGGHVMKGFKLPNPLYYLP